MINVEIIPVLDDNYAYILVADDGAVAVVDPGEAAPIIAFLDAHTLSPSYIFNTHHHGDHIAGNADLTQRYGAKLVGPALEAARIPDMDITLSEGDDFHFGGEAVTIFETPGHTRGHICFYFPKSGLAFTGDTLFSMGCGRLFEGDADTMWASLQKLAALPDETRIYCGHEYTMSNGAFCLQHDPDNAALKARMDEVKRARAQNYPTLPVTLKTEKATNIFLRAGSAKEFGRLRAAKDQS